VGSLWAFFSVLVYEEWNYSFHFSSFTEVEIIYYWEHCSNVVDDSLDKYLEFYWIVSVS